MILLVSSNKDIASQTIKQQILKHYIFHETTETFEHNPVYTADVNEKKVTLITLNEESVTAQDLPEKFPDAKLIVFISRHSSQSAKPTLTVHTPGNFGSCRTRRITQKRLRFPRGRHANSPKSPITLQTATVTS